ncbi:Abscission/NoCut checkpoint regulator [Cladorrhinum sp. PSN332]|nr:Abscission/NoCut checkpoint regulator [Cladorrhinum sp. PSN332]
MPSDQSLLDRLNALKASSVSFERPSSSITAPLHDENPQSVSREDALAARLRSLRNQPNKDSSGNGNGGGGQPPSEIRSNSSAQPPSPPQQEPVTINKSPNQKVGDQASLSPSSGDQYQIPPDWEVPANDDVSVEEYLEALGDQSDWGFLKPDEDEPGIGNAPPESKHEAPDPKHEAENLKRLLQQLKIADREANEDDNSDGEQMTRDVEAILSQVRDEISLLPSVPEGVGGTTQDGEVTETTTEDSLSLPSVPSQPPKDEVDDLTARLLSLRGIGPVDAFGLPAAPTFQPDKRPGATTTQSSSSQSILHKNSRNKYSDSDQSTWCVVCLEDATVKCEGCDYDVYCFRCWKEMHVGVRAGYEERGHRWVKFDKGGGTSGNGGL